MESQPGTVWFRYTLTGSRFTARPVAWQGYAILAALIVGMILIVSAANRLFSSTSVFLSLAVIFSAVLLILPRIKRLIMAHGEAE